jgi:hypothetical protein
MPHRIWLVGLLMAVGGCVQEQTGLSVVSSGFFDEKPELAATPAGSLIHAAASEEAGKRVLQVGGQIIASNPKLGFKPAFTTIGAPWEEIFHRGDMAVFITEGLVRECVTDGQLAAVLSHELGKIAAERQDLAATAPQDRGPPPDAPVGNDGGGVFGAPDGTRTMELAADEQKRRKAAAAALAPVDPEALARTILQKAGGTPADAEAAAPLLHRADEHTTFEKQMSGRN